MHFYPSTEKLQRTLSAPEDVDYDEDDEEVSFVTSRVQRESLTPPRIREITALPDKYLSPSPSLWDHKSDSSDYESDGTVSDGEVEEECMTLTSRGSQEHIQKGKYGIG